MSAVNPHIGDIRVLVRQKRVDEARDLLTRAAAQVEPLMRKRSWKVGKLREFFPSDKCLLGLNINRGMEVRVRLRPAHNPDSFYDYDFILGTLLHELVHNRIAPHNAAFQALFEELWDEVFELRSQGFTGNGFFSQGTRVGHGTGATTLQSVAEAKRAAAAAAERRGALGLAQSGGRKLGGSSGAPNLSPREMAARAAIRRSLQSNQCGNSTGTLTPARAKERAGPPAEKTVIVLDDSDEDEMDVGDGDDLKGDDADATNDDWGPAPGPARLPVLDRHGVLTLCFVRSVFTVFLPVGYLAALVPAYLYYARARRSRLGNAGYAPISTIDPDSGIAVEGEVHFAKPPPKPTTWLAATKLALMLVALASTVCQWWVAESLSDELFAVHAGVWALLIVFTVASNNQRSHVYALPALVFPTVAAILDPAKSLTWAYYSAPALLVTLVGLAEYQVQRKRHEDYLASRYTDSGYLPSLEETVSTFSQWVTYSYLNPLLRLGSQKHLEDKDIWEVIHDDAAKTSWATFAAHRQRTGQFGYSIVRTIVPLLSVQIVCGIASAFFSFTGPFFLNRLVAFIEKRSPDDDSLMQGYLLVLGLFVFTNLNNLFESRAAFCGTRAGFRVRSILITEVYLKVLTRKASHSAGKITNYFGSDASRVHIWFCWAHGLFVTPLQLVIAISSLYFVLGWSSIVGVSFLVLLIPVQSYLTKRMYARQKLVMAATDTRMSRITEMLSSIRIVKFMAWESKFAERITDARRTELHRMRSYFIVQALAYAVYTSGLILVSLVTFLSYTKLQGGILDATTCFTAIALFRALNNPIDDLSYRITSFFETRVSYHRIRKFLKDEVDMDYYEQHPLSATVLNDNENNAHQAAVAAAAAVAAGSARAPLLGSAASAAAAYGTFRADSGNDLLQTAAPPAVGFKNATLSWADSIAPEEEDDDKAKTTEADKKKEKESAKPATAPAAAVASSSSSSSSSASGLPTEDSVSLTEPEPFKLKNLDVQFPAGKLSLIVGLTASGKSSVLNGLLGEMKLESGAVQMPADGVALVSQQAWLMNATIRKNITFSLPYDELRYNRVVDACALTRDFEILAGGDLTEVGQRGIICSGGQKQRINLARATYSNASVILVDDSLSALDAPTGRAVFEKAILGELAGRTRIMVTNAVSLAAAKADFIVVMRGGEAVAQGDLATVTAQLQGTEEARLFESIEGDDEDDDDEGTTVDAAEPSSSDDDKAGAERAAKATAGKSGVAANTVEAKRNGRVELGVYFMYLRATGGVRFWAFFLVGTFATYLCRIAADNWLRIWAKQYTSEAPAGSVEPTAAFGIAALVRVLQQTVDVNFYLGVYSIIGLVTVFVQFGQSYYKYIGSMRASRRLHSQLLNSVLAAPVSFFDSTPTGRLQNRFSQDMGSIDSSIMNSLSSFISFVVGMAVELGLVGAVVPMFLLVVPFLLYLYWSIADYYLATTREIKRIQSTHQSPQFSHFEESIAGASCIRAYRAEPRFIRHMWRTVDNVNRGLVSQIGLNRWMSQRTGFADSLVLLCTGLAILFSLDTLDGGLAGFTLSYALVFSSSVVWLIRTWSMLEISANAVERVGEWLNLPREEDTLVAASLEDQSQQIVNGTAPADAAAQPPRILQSVPASWPAHGRVEFKDVTCRYRADLPPVLHNIHFTVAPGERVAICGRTGAGKSSAVLSLFRFISCETGAITIDGIDISTISLHDLRSRLAILPQDPVLFEGTVRQNLDVFGEFDDEVLWRALNRVQCSGATPLTLDTQVAEGASSLSVGQRQLLCIARALLKSAKIVVMDESTASIDAISDTKIQSVIRESPEFAGSSIICIAHRIKTVADFDRIIVLDAGRVVEEGSPYALMHDPASVFFGMCVETGEFETLLQLAEETEAKKRAQS
ncbi:Transporter of the ATP-binding cassette (ABC) [Blastocladiella emersonii ATCC 22665]|nr:Transporter of the ATP-binding cassette (ABC) [Blastocladiella emersonii ATCC 22665]